MTGMPGCGQLWTANMKNDLSAHLSDSKLRVGSYDFDSRLLVGTGKYKDFAEMRDALELSGTDCVTVAIRRVDLKAAKGESIFDYIDRDKYTILPNTAFCFDAESALRTARLARELLGTDLCKLEVLGDTQTLLPDPVATLEATRILADEGFTVMVYTSDDPRLAVHLAEAGAAAIMPAGSPIGSGQGVLNPGLTQQANNPFNRVTLGDPAQVYSYTRGLETNGLRRLVQDHVVIINILQLSRDLVLVRMFTRTKIVQLADAVVADVKGAVGGDGNFHGDLK